MALILLIYEDNELLRESISGSTAVWGLEVQRFEMKDVECP